MQLGQQKLPNAQPKSSRSSKQQQLPQLQQQHIWPAPAAAVLAVGLVRLAAVAAAAVEGLVAGVAVLMLLPSASLVWRPTTPCPSWNAS